MSTIGSRRKNLNRIEFDTKVNASLWLDKFIKGQNIEGDEPRRNDEKPFKNQLIDEVTAIETPDIYGKFFERWLESLDAVGAKFKSLEVDGRMVVGLGAESVLETSIALHRTYGVPYISGSALKGLAASYAHKHLGSDWKKETKTTKLGKAHEFVFGSQDSAGFIIFHDALYVPKTGKNNQETKKNQALWADIMTVHHRDYYGDEDVAPADWDNPVPIPFLSATGNYLAAISCVEGADKWIEFVWLILEKSLQEEGIGAKTSSGYGRAKLTDDIKPTEKMRRREDERRKAASERIKREAEEANEQARLEAERRRIEMQTQFETAAQEANKQRQTAVETRIGKNFEQIKAINAATKKPEKIFEEIAGLIYKVENAERKRDFSKTVLAEVERLKNDRLEINTSGKWFITLKKMSGEKQ